MLAPMYHSTPGNRGLNVLSQQTTARLSVRRRFHSRGFFLFRYRTACGSKRVHPNSKEIYDPPKEAQRQNSKAQSPTAQRTRQAPRRLHQDDEGIQSQSAKA